MSNSIKIKASGSVANVSCGFDCLGYSLDSPADILEITKNNSSKINISMTGLNINQGFNVKIEKGIPPGSGIGSSASSAVGAVYGVNQLLDNPLTSRELLVHSMAGEAVASGGFHADNVAPSLLGGMILIRSYKPLDIIQIPIPEKLWSTVILPNYTINTKDATGPSRT